MQNMGGLEVVFTLKERPPPPSLPKQWQDARSPKRKEREVTRDWTELAMDGGCLLFVLLKSEVRMVSCSSSEVRERERE